jgi:glycine C-acetyltransferase/8-amino-7-oxononanoate synthase
MESTNWMRRTLDDLAARGLLRRPLTVEGRQGPRVRVGGRNLLCFCSNNYLGLADHPALAEASKAALDTCGTGAGASRLVSGTMTLHRELEDAIARFEGTEAALVFATGYMANIGTIAALVGRSDTVYSDRWNHASIVDGCRLSGASLRVYPHKDVDRLDRLLARDRGGRMLVVSDTVFSMDGDIAPVADLLDVCDRHGAMLMIDDAHATGVLGSAGWDVSGVERDPAGSEPATLGSQLIRMGTLSKAVGSIGGFVAGSRDLIDLLVNRARSFIYTTAPPPAACAASLAGLRIIGAEPERRAALWSRARQLQDGLRDRGLQTGATETPITPLIVGEPDAAVALSARLLECGILAPAIRPPTVPKGTARLRLTPIATHGEEDVGAVLRAIDTARRQGVTVA